MHEPDLKRKEDLISEILPTDPRPPGFSKPWVEPQEALRKEVSNIAVFDLLAELTANQRRTIKFLQKMKLLHTRRACDSCDNADMGLFSRRDNDWFFKCNKRGIEKQCQRMVSFKTDTFFAKSKLNLKQLMPVIYAFTEDLPNSWVERNVGLSHTTVVDWYSFLREVCMQAIEDGSLSRDKDWWYRCSS